MIGIITYRNALADLLKRDNAEEEAIVRAVTNRDFLMNTFEKNVVNTAGATVQGLDYINGVYTRIISPILERIGLEDDIFQHEYILRRYFSSLIDFPNEHMFFDQLNAELNN